MKETFFTLKMPDQATVERTYFFRRRNGEVFSCNERSASAAMLLRAGVNGVAATYLGVSDGTTFRRAYEAAIREQNEALTLLGEYPEGAAAKSRSKWIAERRKIEAKAKAAVSEAMLLEQAEAEKHKEEPPDTRTEVHGDTYGVVSKAQIQTLGRRL